MENKEKNNLVKQFNFLYDVFKKIINQDQKAIIDLLEDSISYKKVVEILVLCSIREFSKDAKDKNLGAMYAVCNKKVEEETKKIGAEDPDIAEKISKIMFKFYHKWENILITFIREQLDKKEKQDNDQKLKTDKKTSSSQLDRLNKICNCFGELMQKEEEFNELVGSYPKNVRNHIIQALVFCFSAHLYQNIISKNTAYNWQEIVDGNEILFFKAVYKKLNDIKKTLEDNDVDTAKLEDEINELYRMFYKSYEKKAFKKIIGK